MTICAECTTAISNRSPGIICNTCGTTYHAKCAGVNLPAIKSAKGIFWKCTVCVNRTSKRSSIIYPSTSSEIDSNSTSNNNLDLPIDSPLIVVIREEFKSLKSQFSELSSSMTFCCNKIDDFEASIQQINAKFNQFEKIVAENKQLKADVETLTHKVNSLEQRSRSNNIELHGIPESKDENLSKIVLEIGSELGCNIAEHDIQCAYRIRNNAFRNPSNRSILSHIVVELQSRHVKNKIIASMNAKRKQIKSINNSNPHISIPGITDKLFINEHLSKYNKNLFYKLRKTAKEKGIKYVWTKNCVIYARKNDTSKACVISSENDILNLN